MNEMDPERLELRKRIKVCASLVGQMALRW